MRTIIFTFCFLLSACASKPQQTLYQEMGGMPVIETIADQLIQNIGHDKTIFPYFAKADVTHFRNGFIQHLCDVTNGPCNYTGDTMQAIHTGMNINESDFNHLVELLINAMTQSKVPHRTQNKLLARLAPMRAQIIER